MFRIFFIGLALVSIPAIAAAEPTVESRTVRLADLDLGGPGGRAQLDQRIVDACGEASAVDLAARNAVRVCRADAKAKADAAQQARLARRSAGQSASGQQ